MEVIGIFSEGYGSGKDSVATTLAFDFDYVIYGFSEYLKDHLYRKVAHEMFPSFNLWLQYVDEHKYDKPEQEGYFIRKLLQSWGQLHRFKNPDYWVEAWEAAVREKGYEKVAVPNVRFPNEARKIKELGGTLIKVIRPGVVIDSDPSEVSMNGWTPDHTILNDGTLLDLAEKVRKLMRENGKELTKV